MSWFITTWCGLSVELSVTLSKEGESSANLWARLMLSYICVNVQVFFSISNRRWSSMHGWLLVICAEQGCWVIDHIPAALMCVKHFSLSCPPKHRQRRRTAAICALFPSNITRHESKEHQTYQAMFCFPIPAIRRNRMSVLRTLAWAKQPTCIFSTFFTKVLSLSWIWWPLIFFCADIFM